MQYDVITIDTQTVFDNGFRLESGLLAQLRQFQTGPTRFVASLVVMREIVKHLTLRTEDAHKALQGGLAKALDLQLPVVAPDLSAIDPRTVARGRVEAFIKTTGATVIDYRDVALPEVMERFFKASPPFAASGKKKAEFPDAVALMSLEAWAKANGKRILAVTADGDWAAFAAQSTYIEVEPKLADALARLQQDAEAAADIVASLLADIAHDADSEIRAPFIDSLESEVPGCPAFGEAQSYHAVEPDQVDLTYLGFALKDAVEDRAFEVVQARHDYLVVQLDLLLDVEADGSFSLQAWDSIDRDYVGLGSLSATTEARVEATALVTFEREEPEDHWVVATLELIGPGPTIDFGYIEPDYSREWEE